MKYLITLIVFAFCHSLVFAQNHNDTIVKRYMTIKDYRIKFKKPLTKSDTLNFRFRENDTMVLLDEFSRKKNVKVPYEYKDSTFLYYYKKVAFNDRNDTISKKNTMKYWKEDIRIFFSKSVSRKTKKNLMEFASIIDKAVDSLQISEVNKVEDSNYVVYYFGDYDYEPRLANFTYSEMFSWWNKNQLHRHSIKIDTKTYFNEKLIQAQLRQYFVKSLGYFYVIDDLSCESYFSNCYSPDKYLTTLDLELIKYHYSYGICKGTNLETFEGQHKRAQEMLKEKGHRMYFIHSDDEE